MEVHIGIPVSNFISSLHTGKLHLTHMHFLLDHLNLMHVIYK